MTTFEYDLRILESHLDTFGHVNNATYLELYEEARWDFITKRDYGLKVVQELGLGPVILELELKFKKELKNREVIKIESRPLELVNSLVMTMEQRMIKENGDVASTLLLKVGLMDLKARKLVRPTPLWNYAAGYTDSLEGSEPEEEGEGEIL